MPFAEMRGLTVDCVGRLADSESRAGQTPRSKLDIEYSASGFRNSFTKRECFSATRDVILPYDIEPRWTPAKSADDNTSVIGRVVLTALLILSCARADFGAATPGQTPRPGNVATTSGGIIRGVVTTQSGTIPLGGVLVSLTSTRTNQVKTVISEGDGSYRFDGSGSRRLPGLGVD